MAVNKLSPVAIIDLISQSFSVCIVESEAEFNLFSNIRKPRKVISDSNSLLLELMSSGLIDFEAKAISL